MNVYNHAGSYGEIMLAVSATSISLDYLLGPRDVNQLALSSTPSNSLSGHVKECTKLFKKSWDLSLVFVF